MKTLWLFIGLIGASVGCSSYKVTTNRTDKTTDWASYRTFTFIDTNRIDPTPRDTYQASIEQVKRAVATELTNRGYQQIASNQIGTSADLLINIGGIVREKTQTRETTIYEAPRYIGQRRYHWQSQEVPVGTYQEGAVNIHIVDAQRNNLLWDAVVSSVLRKGNVTPDQIQEGVHQLFAKFPGSRS
ncbi:DUF4136 domain-containing protein [Spirosoma validum]|uniref:DUF4136 domain-containing protein n=1 Tax=Spirosoma validum TaxID=2771355 RepID=A0A927B695_9BACT|nr:DUF4136 domain-containing protein [Spirosoma validum]MBD2756002.1 DUF4136 domain-containing protein [Spirosoma validum]